MNLGAKLRRKAHVKKKQEELGLRYKKKVLADRKELLTIPSQETSSVQTNTKTPLDIWYPNLGLHQTKQYRHYKTISEQITQEHCKCTLLH
jgi:uncharacterized membrane protein (UPF0127 family)